MSSASAAPGATSVAKPSAPPSAAPGAAPSTRASRSLLFGSAGGGAHAASVPPSTTYALERDNQMGLEAMRFSAAAMRSVAVSVDASVTQQNELIDDVHRRVHSGSHSITHLLTALRASTRARSRGAFVAIVLGACGALLLLRFWLARA